MTSPKEESKICVTCGLCCDGTLFSTVTLNLGEKGVLHEKLVASYGNNDGQEFFRQPCACFSGICTTYLNKPQVCSSFRCKLLKKFAKNEYTLKEAMDIVENALASRNEVEELYKTTFKKQNALSFRQILEAIGKEEDTETLSIEMSKDFQLLRIKALILETLLIKHFKSTEDFEKMIDNTTNNEID